MLRDGLFRVYVHTMPPDAGMHALRAAYDRTADDYDQRFRALQRLKFVTMLHAGGDELAARLQDGRVLDLGCGTGLLGEYLADVGHEARCIIGLDLSHRMLRHAGHRGVVAVQGDAAALGFAGASFDVVLAFTVLEIWPDPERTRLALEEVRRVLSVDGIFAVTVLAAADALGFAEHLAAAGFSAVRVPDCGQDVGYVCRRQR